MHSSVWEIEIFIKVACEIQLCIEKLKYDKMGDVNEYRRIENREIHNGVTKLKILAFDTSNQPLSVGIIDGDTILTEQLINIKRNHSIQLMPAIEEALKQANSKLEEIDRIAVGSGPGSYTGLRIAVTVAKSLAWTKKIELVGISSLKVIAANHVAASDHYIVPIIDARRENIYTGLYKRKADGELIEVSEDRHIASAEYATQLAKKEGTFELIGLDAPQFYDTFREVLGNRVTLAHPTLHAPRASSLAFLAKNEEVIPAHELVPSYLKLAEAEENWLNENPDFKGDDWVEKV